VKTLTRCLGLLALVGLVAIRPAAAPQPAAVLDTARLSALAPRSIGPANMSGRVVDLAVVESDPYTFYVATATGGLWKTSDNGVTFEPLFQREAVHSIGAVAVHQASPSLVWLGSGERANRQSSSWGDGVYKSTDGGKTWKQLTRGLPEGDWGRVGISIYRKDSRIVYVCVEQGLRYNASTAYEERKAGVYRSEDRGESWTHMSDWNPRPMYASQILVDPNDDKRIYMVNAYSFSDDGGKTFTQPRQALHGDDRIVWVSPRNSNHVMKGDDGGLGISYDRGLKWLYVTSLPVSQFYRVDVDMRKPFWLCGGLQDNKSWCGPSATYSTQGILNEDWFRVGGGDGFFNRIDPTDWRTVYTASQYLGISRLDIGSFERVEIRPGDPTGHIAGRRNWKTWGQPGAKEPPLGNAMEPANWDAPFILSPHDPATIYAGTRHLWKSTDRGDTWTNLGDLTTGVDRSTLAIMGQQPGRQTLSLDDGIPYYPTITALSESPVRRGLLYAGTDDGNLQVSRDDGKTWTNVAAHIAGLPKGSWASAVEASRHAEETVYAAFDNHASDDYANYLFKSTDYGGTWTSIVGDLPANRVVKTVHEDARTPNLLYIGTEFGFFLSIDGGGRWVRLESGLPTVPVNDFVVHPRDNDLVLATHGRGIWILDNITALQELTVQVMASDAHLFSIEPAEMIRYTNLKAHQGDMVFRGANPSSGAIIDYWLGSAGTAPAITVHDPAGRQIRRLEATARDGMNRIGWDLRHEPFATGMQGQSGRRGPQLDGPLVAPGEYRVRLSHDGRTMEQPVRVDEDPRVDVTPSVRRSWTATLLALGELYRATDDLLAKARLAAERVIKDAAASASLKGEAEELLDALVELRSRVSDLYREIEGHAGAITADQASRLTYYPRVRSELEQRVAKLGGM